MMYMCISLPVIVLPKSFGRVTHATLLGLRFKVDCSRNHYFKKGEAAFTYGVSIKVFMSMTEVFPGSLSNGC